MRASKAQVLLSTYNGQRYLKELMDSVLNQDFPHLEMLVRDDGSTDETLRVLEEYRGLKNVQIVPGKNLGVVRSFFTLLESSSPEAAYIAFCDQDDIWEKDKVSRAISMLEQNGGNMPAMYCSRVTLADEKLKVLGASQALKREPAFGNALVQNVATGCTIIINKTARELILRKIPTAAIIHDWWIYLVVSAFGKVIYDAESRILYRQHSTNLIGEKSGWCAKWIKRFVRLFKRSGVPVVALQAEELREIYGDALPLDKKMILERFINERGTFWGRLRYAFSGGTYRQTKVDDLIFRVLIILNLI